MSIIQETLINEIDNSNLLSLKLKDVEALLLKKDTPDYYIKYLKITQHILKHNNPKSIAEDLLAKALKYEFNQKNIDELYSELLRIVDHDR
jgi:hypothetical protein